MPYILFEVPLCLCRWIDGFSPYVKLYIRGIMQSNQLCKVAGVNRRYWPACARLTLHKHTAIDRAAGASSKDPYLPARQAHHQQLKVSKPSPVPDVLSGHPPWHRFHLW